MALLFDAIDAVLNAIKIFSADCDSSLVSAVEPNCHGLALAEFQLGCLYEHYWPELVSKLPKGKSEFAVRFAKMHMKDKEYCFVRAKECFDRAFEFFKKLNHLKGMYLSQKHKLAVYSTDYAQYRQLIEKQVKECGDKCAAYAKEVGLSSSCYIEREQGEEISVMTELVLER